MTYVVVKVWFWQKDYLVTLEKVNVIKREARINIVICIYLGYG